MDKDQVMEILKKIVVSVDINENAVVISTMKLLSHFLSNVEALDKIIKVDVNDDKEIVVYASAKPTKPGIKSIIFKVTLYSNVFNIPNMKYEIVKADNDVYIKVYVKQDIVPSTSNVNVDNEVDF
jgi:adenosine deaminase